MINPNIFQRSEIKYMITASQKNKLKNAFQEHMRPDIHGRSTICNIYFDTATKYLIRHSLEHPVYKEKLRLRSYGVAAPDTEVFLELKKKYKSIVYKRRISIPEHDAMDYLCGHKPLPKPSQISHEIDYFSKIYPDLSPSVVLSYEREAFYDITNDDFRVTFDQNILWRNYDFSLCAGIYGEPLLQEDQVLMEIKTDNAIPLWMVELLSEEKIFKTSFSKYGRAYEQMQAIKGGTIYA